MGKSTVHIMAFMAILQHLNVSKDAIIAGKVDTLYNFVTN